MGNVLIAIAALCQVHPASNNYRYYSPEEVHKQQVECQQKLTKCSGVDPDSMDWKLAQCIKDGAHK